MNCKLYALFAAAAALLAPATRAQADAHKAEGAVPIVPAQPVHAGHDHPAPAVTGQPQSGNTWFAVDDQDLGTHFNHDTAIGRFAFKNPRSEAVAWKSMVGSCQCSKAVITVGERRYRFSTKPVPNTILRVTGEGDGEREERVSQIEVGAGEEGVVEVHMELGGVAGSRNATLAIHMTDPELPLVTLKWRAVGAVVFNISPPDVNLNQMVWNEKRDFTVTVQSPLQRDFNITGYQNADPDFAVTYEKTMTADMATWTIKGTYAPHSADVAGGGVLNFTTDVAGQPALTIRVSAAIQGPLEVRPGTFLTLGMIRKGTARTERVVFEPNDGTELLATDLRFERLTVDPKFVQTHQSKDGNKLVVEIEVSKDAPSGLLRGDLVVELNHPAVKSKKILFNGFIR